MVRERTQREGEALALRRQTLSVAELRQLIALMNASDIEELLIEQESSGLKLVLRKPPRPIVPTVEPELELAESAEGLAAADAMASQATSSASDLEVRAPLVGIFRAGPTGGDDPAISRGDHVENGQVVGAIEALNVLNELEAPSPGRIKDVFVRDGQAVEYGQLLLIIAASGLSNGSGGK
jgi:biotin carboxyl carrier protein